MNTVRRVAALSSLDARVLALLSLLSIFPCVACAKGTPKEPPESAVASPPASTPEIICDATKIEPGPAPHRRLTHREYGNTVSDLFGSSSNPAASFSPEEQSLGFDNNATVRSTSLLLVEQYESAAHVLAQSASLDLPRFIGCDPQGPAEEGCIGAFLARFGEATFRRPLKTLELERANTFYRSLRVDHSVEKAVELVVAAWLQSAPFLYRLEEQEAAPSPEATPYQVSPHALASRLSYLFWQRPPDSILLNAAAQNQLETKEQVRAQAVRLLTDPKARPALVDFYAQWFDFDLMDRPTKDAALFPKFSAALGPLLRQESERFVEHSLFNGPADIGTLLASPQAFLNDALASFYGVPLPNSPDLVPVTLPSTQRAGLLTRAGWLAGHATPTLGSPVARGFFVRDRLLCQTPPPPPKDIVIQVPEYDPNLTTRARFAQHQANAVCSSCHSLMDPIGLGFEHYDAVGLWREQEANAPVDATGALTATDVDGPFNGAIELASLLATSKTVQDCAVTQWFRFAYGRLETPSDTCTLRKLKTAFASSGGNLGELMLELTSTDAFLYRPGTQG